MSKIILQALIRKPADYYDAEELLQEELMLNAAGVSITNEHETDPEGEPIEATHLEAHIEGIEPAEPEEIITEIPEAVHESIEIIPHDEEEEIASASGELTDIEEPDELIEIEETEDYIDLPEKETKPAPEPVSEPEQEPDAEEQLEELSESEPEEQEEEPVPAPESEETAEEEPVPEPEITEPEAEEPIEVTPEPEPAAEEPAEEKEPDYTFKIKAKTSRTKRPKRKEDEERAEEEAAARAAMEAAQAAADDRVPGWTESYADIRSSLEKAFLADTAPDTDTEKADADTTPDNEIKGKDKAPDDNTGKKKNNRKRNRKPKPSMKMNKKELTDIAESRGIKVPEEATKREILDLIYAETDRNQN